MVTDHIKDHQLHKSNYFKTQVFDEQAFFFYQQVKQRRIYSNPNNLAVDLRLYTLGLKDFSSLF